VNRISQWRGRQGNRPQGQARRHARLTRLSPALGAAREWRDVASAVAPHARRPRVALGLAAPRTVATGTASLSATGARHSRFARRAPPPLAGPPRIQLRRARGAPHQVSSGLSLLTRPQSVSQTTRSFERAQAQTRRKRSARCLVAHHLLEPQQCALPKLSAGQQSPD
jgi:hypothetical protein